MPLKLCSSSFKNWVWFFVSCKTENYLNLLVSYSEKSHSFINLIRSIFHFMSFIFLLMINEPDVAQPFCMIVRRFFWSSFFLPFSFAETNKNKKIWNGNHENWFEGARQREMFDLSSKLPFDMLEIYFMTSIK